MNLSSVLETWKFLLFDLVTPSSRLQSGVVRRQARILMSVLVVLVPLALMNAVVVTFNPVAIASNKVLAWFIFFGFAFCYALSRTHRYTLTAAATISLFTAICGLLAWSTVSTDGSTGGLMWLLPPLVLASTLLTIERFSLYALGIVGATITLGISAEISLSTLIGQPIINVVLVSVFLITTTWLRQVDRAQIESQSAELQQANERLEDEVGERTRALSDANFQLQQANRYKDQFLASMSHELRTPLNAILGISEALRVQVYGDVNDQQADRLRRIENSGKHLLSLINDVLDIAKIEAGQLDIDKEPVYLKHIATTSIQLVQQQASSRGIRLIFQDDPFVSTVIGDERRLTQVMVNLLSNAVKFTPSGGQVGLKITGDARNHSVSVKVWDTGVGIAEEKQELLFQPFVQADSTVSQQFDGTGLGLSLVKRLVEIHGGAVTLNSELGVGSVFTIALPWDAGPAYMAAASQQPAEMLTW